MPGGQKAGAGAIQHRVKVGLAEDAETTRMMQGAQKRCPPGGQRAHQGMIGRKDVPSHARSSNEARVGKDGFSSSASQPFLAES